MSHNAEKGTLDREFEEVPHSASNWKTFLRKKEFHTHPYRYPSGITNIVGSLGAGKSTLVYNLLSELDEILEPKKIGRIVYYSGSGSDRLLEAYDPKRVEIYDRRSKESFLTAIREIINEASTTPHEERRMNIVVADDAITDRDIMPSSIKSDTPLSTLMMSARHIPVSIFLTSQKYNSLPTFARHNANHLFVFRTKSPAERKSIVQEVNFTPKEAETALDSMTENGDFLWFQMADRKLIRGFNQGLVS